MDGRGISPVVGTCVIVVLTVLLVAATGTIMLGADHHQKPATTTRLSASVDASDDRIALTHEGGDTLAPESLALRVRINGTPLDRQPPIPFFAAKGFRAGPTGPFNAATTGKWTAGETGSIRLASTNAPNLTAGARVELTLLEGEDVLATVETTAG
ncbi:type IV pilin N-terminal domain-containing protein [Halorhabdus amylolytica]|uniref:type IV pilin N-terminal domain-containing protein n=1 Tax=Halorhabdus amylolytica TaxID=2559573 RepID=UPI0010AB394A|nr:type IV pilin N-terminal domain-containing protein [Halorhabdus amylolytica]